MFKCVRVCVPPVAVAEYTLLLVLYSIKTVGDGKVMTASESGQTAVI